MLAGLLGRLRLLVAWWPAVARAEALAEWHACGGLPNFYLPSVGRATQPGAALEFSFRGTCFGLAGFRGPDPGQFAGRVDAGPALKSTLFDSHAYAGQSSHRAWFFPGDLANGLHRVKRELLAEPPDKAGILKAHGLKLTDVEKNAGNTLTLGAVLIAGEMVAEGGGSARAVAR